MRTQDDFVAELDETLAVQRREHIEVVPVAVGATDVDPAVRVGLQELVFRVPQRDRLPVLQTGPRREPDFLARDPDGVLLGGGDRRRVRTCEEAEYVRTTFSRSNYSGLEGGSWGSDVAYVCAPMPSGEPVRKPYIDLNAILSPTITAAGRSTPSCHSRPAPHRPYGVGRTRCHAIPLRH